MKYLIPLLFLIPWPVFAGEIPDFSQEERMGMPYLVLETSEGEWIKWPKHILPMIRVFSVSTESIKTQKYVAYQFIINYNGKRYAIEMPEKSYKKYKKMMGIR
jgi:hypothetical protein